MCLVHHHYLYNIKRGTFILHPQTKHFFQLFQTKHSTIILSANTFIQLTHFCFVFNCTKDYYEKSNEQVKKNSSHSIFIQTSKRVFQGQVI